MLCVHKSDAVPVFANLKAVSKYGNMLTQETLFEREFVQSGFEHTRKNNKKQLFA